METPADRCGAGPYNLTHRLLSRRRALALGAGAPFAARAAAPAERRNVIVFKEAGRYGGWPANHGIWSWGNEIVVGFTVAHYMKLEKGGHQVDRSKPYEDWQARSLDGGETWTLEKPPALAPPEAGGPKLSRLARPADFQARDFAMMFRANNVNVGPSRFYLSQDRARTWMGPYEFAVEGIDKIGTRTDTIALGRRECMMWGSAAKANDREGRVFCARTADGGLSWKLVARIGPEPAGYMIMPSTVQVGRGRYVTAIRHKDPDKQGAIDVYASADGGRTWESLGEAASNLGAGNPPSLLRLRDRRLCLIYGYRAKPFGVRARLSQDQGRTWGEELVLRDDSPTADLGYPRSVQRPDGLLVSVYYFNGPKDDDRAIEATIWKP